MSSPSTVCRNHLSLSQVYPDLRRIMLFVAFEEAGPESEPSYQQIIFTAENEAVFRLDCSRVECAGGGFDFTPVVDAMVTNRETRAHGTLSCSGLLGSGGACCALRAEYRIIID